jgi:hypothetical protein
MDNAPLVSVVCYAAGAAIGAITYADTDIGAIRVERRHVGTARP